MNFQEQLEIYAEEPLTRQLMLALLKDYKRPNDKIGELLKSEELTSVKNGLYIPGRKSRIARPEPLLIANHLWGPSYVSFETALSYWGFIPEKVYEISSVTTKLSKKYRTKAGRFTYRHAGLPYYTFGIKNASLSEKQVVLIASPEKAICDKIVMTPGIQLRSPAQVISFLTEDLRIDEDRLRGLNNQMLASWIADAPKRDSLKMLTKALSTI